MRKIKPMTLPGTFGEEAKFKARDKFQIVLEEQLRERGYVPVIDRNTEWYTSWDEEREIYNFELVMYGVYVGAKKAREEIVGWSEEKGEAIT